MVAEEAAKFIKDELKKKYGTDKWTRVHSLELRYMSRDSLFSIASDMLAFKQYQEELTMPKYHRGTPLFDPEPLKKELEGCDADEYALSDDFLVLWGKKATNLRKQIDQVVASLKPAKKENFISSSNPRTRKGMKYSTKKNSSDGLGSGEWRALVKA